MNKACPSHWFLWCPMISDTSPELKPVFSDVFFSPCVFQWVCLASVSACPSREGGLMSFLLGRGRTKHEPMKQARFQAVRIWGPFLNMELLMGDILGQYQPWKRKSRNVKLPSSQKIDDAVPRVTLSHWDLEQPSRQCQRSSRAMVDVFPHGSSILLSAQVSKPPPV